MHLAEIKLCLTPAPPRHLPQPHHRVYQQVDGHIFGGVGIGVTEGIVDVGDKPQQEDEQKGNHQDEERGFLQCIGDREHQASAQQHDARCG